MRVGWPPNVVRPGPSPAGSLLQTLTRRHEQFLVVRLKRLDQSSLQKAVDGVQRPDLSVVLYEATQVLRPLAINRSRRCSFGA
jgi:hypothetical protein